MLNEITLGQNIEQARVNAGLNQQQLADLVELDRSAISRVESGSRKVDSIELVKIAAALGVTELSLLTVQETEAIYLRAPESEPESIKQQIKWVNGFFENYEFLKELG
ncbi:MAG TPA: helix-turn-helix transcriptional regulator [Candidatus Aquicultor sp.]|jgi:transcriptional regulator with XRE-family HTH domain